MSIIFGFALHALSGLLLIWPQDWGYVVGIANLILVGAYVAVCAILWHMETRKK